ncbi:hypothetical protein ACFSUS_02860 [Spirosoma soli]|uniref:Uncharacterized protein n=1 Tax=Spirosoma soli TaxID=1770529 RepID=A0ABW5LZ55_9BACT
MRRWMYVAIVSSVLLLLFLGFKVLRFQALYYVFNDMYIFLQASCSWMDGRPLLYENIWGYDDRIHNNYGLILWGPLIYVWGAYGAFIVQTALYTVSYTLLIRQLSNGLPGWLSWTMLFTVLLGPVWFWFNEHPGIGWHPELTYLPLSILFILALDSRQKGWVVLTGALIVLVKEDGALLAGSIHLAYVCLQYLKNNPHTSIFSVLTHPRFWVTLVSWAVLFVAGMLFLSYKNHAVEPEPRLQQALNAITTGLHQTEFVRIHAALLGHVVLLILPSFLLLLYLLWRFEVRQIGSIVLVYMVAQIGILMSNWVQGATYYGSNPFFHLVSLTWPPRFVLTYAFSVCYILAAVFVFKRAMRPVASWQPTALASGLFLIQLLIVPYARPDFTWSAELRDTFAHRFDPQKQPMLPDNDVAIIEQLAQTIPARSNVFVFDYLIPLFHKHYNIWPTEKQWEKADLAIIPNNDFQKLGERMPRVMKQPLRSRRLETYTLFFSPAYEPYVNAILK